MHNPVYEDIATKFFEHFLHIAEAMTTRATATSACGTRRTSSTTTGSSCRTRGAELPLRVRSMVGLIPLFAVEELEPEMLERLPGFPRRLEWFLNNRPDLATWSRAGRSRASASGGCCRCCAGTG